VRAEGPKYDGEYIRVRGLLGQCKGFPCELTPISSDGKPDWGARSLRLTFSHDAPTLNALDSVMPERVTIVLGYLYRFSEITVVGQYDYTCDSAEDVIARQTKLGSPDDITVCADGGAVLHHAMVVTVHHRWPSTAFSRADDARKLIPLSPGTTKTMAAVYRASDGVPVGDQEREYRAFVDSFDDSSAYFCACLKKDCTAQWPTEPQHVPGNPMNPYTCSYAKRTDGVWRFQPSFDR